MNTSSNKLRAEARIKMYFWICLAALLLYLETRVKRKPAPMKCGPLIVLVLEPDPEFSQN